MYSPAVASNFSSSASHARPLVHKTQLTARGPGWRLAEGDFGSWEIELRREADGSTTSWTHLLATLRTIADTHGRRPLLIDLRQAERLAGSAAEAATELFAELESHGLRVAVLVGPDLIQAVRLHRLLGLHARMCGRSFMCADEARDWIRRAPPPVPPPLPRGGRRVALAAPQL
jgi:hypothetical protein